MPRSPAALPFCMLMTSRTANVGKPVISNNSLLGSGIGDASLVLAELVGPSGRIVGVELKSAAVEAARVRTAAIGWQNIDFLAGVSNRSHWSKISTQW
jgi:ubiquinone/menaquinone biosynthesis C-methylase UbiE